MAEGVFREGRPRAPRPSAPLYMRGVRPITVRRIKALGRERNRNIGAVLDSLVRLHRAMRADPRYHELLRRYRLQKPRAR